MSLKAKDDGTFETVPDEGERALRKSTYDAAFDILREAQANNRNFMLMVVKGDNFLLAGNPSVGQIAGMSKMLAAEAASLVIAGLAGKK